MAKMEITINNEVMTVSKPFINKKKAILPYLFLPVFIRKRHTSYGRETRLLVPKLRCLKPILFRVHYTAMFRYVHTYRFDVFVPSV